MGENDSLEVITLSFAKRPLQCHAPANSFASPAVRLSGSEGAVARAPGQSAIGHQTKVAITRRAMILACALRACLASMSSLSVCSRLIARPAVGNAKALRCISGIGSSLKSALPVSRAYSMVFPGTHEHFGAGGQVFRPRVADVSGLAQLGEAVGAPVLAPHAVVHEEQA